MQNSCYASLSPNSLHIQVLVACVLVLPSKQVGTVQLILLLILAQYNMTHHTKLITSYFVHFLFSTLFAVNTWRKEKKRKDDENRVLPESCRFATLVMLLGDVDVLVGEGSIGIRQARVLNCVKPIPNRVIASYPWLECHLVFVPSLLRDSLPFVPDYV